MPPDLVRILLVEDNPTDADLLQETLHNTSGAHFHFTWVERLCEAEVSLSRDVFDVMLLDLSLPDSSGLQTFHRARLAAPLLPIVILTGADDESIGLDAIRHDVQDFLVKGQSDGRQILRALRYAIERKQMADALKQLRDELEVRVVKRTAELAKANDALQREMTERVSAEARQLTAVLEERTRIAREIHDTIAQGLAGIVIQLEAANHCLVRDTETARMRIQTARELARMSLTEARHSVWALRPPVLAHGDLENAITTLIERLPHDESVNIDFSRMGTSVSLPDEMAHDLLRLCQEGLNNALKHAQARRINVMLNFSDEQVTLCVNDDGQGFDPKLLPTKAGFGLRIMEERVVRLGGQFAVTSFPGQGTRMEVQAPLRLQEMELQA